VPFECLASNDALVRDADLKPGNKVAESHNQLFQLPSTTCRAVITKEQNCQGCGAASGGFHVPDD
jgi:hypothetical protein